MTRLVLFVALLVSLMAHAADPIHVLPGLSLTRIPDSLTASIAWDAKTSIHARKDGIWVLGKGNLWRLGQKQAIFVSPAEIQSFARSDAGTLVASIGGKIGLISGRLFLPAFSEPAAGTQLAGGNTDTLLLYGTGVPARIYAFDGGKVAALATLDQPITSLTHIGDTVIFATADGIYSLRPGEPPGLIFPLAGHESITALATNANTAELFAATRDAVYQIGEGRMTQIAQGIGGALAVLEDRVLIADPRRKTIFVLGARRKN